MPRRSDIDAAINTLAAQQHSTVHASQLRALGIDRERVRHRIADGRMRCVLPRTYVVGPAAAAPTWETRCMAGLLHAGAGAALGGDTGGHLLRVWDRGRTDVIDVTGPDAHRRTRHEGYRFHRSIRAWLPPTHVGPLAVLHPVELCVDLARTLTPLQLAFVIGRMRYEEYVTLEALEQHLDACPGRKGAPTLRVAIMLVRSHSAGTRSRSEDAAHAHLERAGMAPDLVNVRGALGMPSDEPDFLYVRERLNVEIDGRQHELREQRSADAARDAEAVRCGFTVLRIPSKFVWTHPDEVVDAIRRARCTAGGCGRRIAMRFQPAMGAQLPRTSWFS